MSKQSDWGVRVTRVSQIPSIISILRGGLVSAKGLLGGLLMGGLVPAKGLLTAYTKYYNK